MKDDNAWFAAKRCGFGAGLPIRWQGWLVTIAAAGALIAIATRFRDRPEVVIPLVLTVGLIFTVIAAKTTRGGWRWRCGD